MKLSHSYSAIKLYDNCPKRYYHQRVTKEVVDTGGEASKNGERIHKFLEERLKQEAELPQEVSKYEELCQAVENQIGSGQLLVEQELTLNNRFRPTTWFAEDAWLRSKLDVLILHPKTAVVMDWKTGKRKPDTFQLDLFAAQVFLHFSNITKVKSSFVWLPDSKMDGETYKREDLPKLLEAVLTKIRRIEQSQAVGVWPAKPSGLCGYCPCKAFCEFARQR